MASGSSSTRSGRRGRVRVARAGTRGCRCPRCVPRASGGRSPGCYASAPRPRRRGGTRTATLGGRSVHEPVDCGGEADGTGRRRTGRRRAERRRIARRPIEAWTSRPSAIWLAALPAVDGTGDPQVSWMIEVDGRGCFTSATPFPRLVVAHRRAVRRAQVRAGADQRRPPDVPAPPAGEPAAGGNGAPSRPLWPPRVSGRAPDSDPLRRLRPAGRIRAGRRSRRSGQGGLPSHIRNRARSGDRVLDPCCQIPAQSGRPAA